METTLELKAESQLVRKAAYNFIISVYNLCMFMWGKPPHFTNSYIF